MIPETPEEKGELTLYREGSEEEKRASEQLLKLRRQPWVDRLRHKMERLKSSDRDFRVKGRLLIYDSKDNISENINGQECYVIDSQKFWCRHWALLRLDRNEDYRDYRDHPQLFEDNMRVILELEREGKLYDAYQYHLVDIRHFGHALAQRCRNLTLGDEEHIRFVSDNHVMSILIKHKVDKKTGEYKGIALEFYDPNETFKHVRVLAPDADALEEFELGNWLGTNAIRSYFPIQQKIGLFHVNAESLETITEKAIVDDSLKINEILPFIFSFPMAGKLIPSLLKKGMDVNYADSLGWTPLFVSSRDGCLEEIELLIGLGADVNQAKNNGITPLAVAAFNGNLEVMRLLIHHGADVNKASNNGVTPLLVAIEFKKIEIVKLLIDAGATIDLSKATEEQLLQLDEWHQQGEINLSRLKAYLKSVYDVQVHKTSSGKGASHTLALFNSGEDAGLATIIGKIKRRAKIGLFNRASKATLQKLTKNPVPVCPSHKRTRKSSLTQMFNSKSAIMLFQGDSDTENESKTTEDGQLVYESPTDEKRVLERVDDVHPRHNAF